VDGGEFMAYSEPVSVNTPGEHTVQFRATDGSGNVSEVGSTTFTVAEAPVEDTTAPTVSAEVAGEQDADGNYVGSASVTVTATDDASGVESVEYSLDGGEFTAYSEAVSVNTPGEHTVEFRATDAAGNVSEVGSTTFTIAEPPVEDTTAPTVTAEVAGNQDADGSYVGMAGVTVTAADEQSGVDAVEYALDGGEWMDYSGVISVDTVGDHTVQFRATDAAGNVSEVGSVSFTVVASDGTDACPDSDTRGTVVIGDMNTGVTNVDTGNGCTINDLIKEDGEYANHGAFVRHVVEVTGRLAAEGVITANDKAQMRRAAAHSDVAR
jgi:hypothetical protein